jgi:hypothetical protein
MIEKFIETNREKLRSKLEDIPVIIIPRQGQDKNIINKLETILEPNEHLDIQRTDFISAISCNLAVYQLSRLNDISELVDLITLDSEEEIPNTEYQSLTLKDFQARLYSPTAKPHDGKMSNASKSNAKYHWIIDSNKLPSTNNVLLIQEIAPNSKTSHHYHENTTEFFLPLFGEGFMHTHKPKSPKGKPEILPKAKFKEITPMTAHQLTTRQKGVVNALLMNPYDPYLRDHYYIKLEGKEKVDPKIINDVALKQHEYLKRKCTTYSIGLIMGVEKSLGNEGVTEVKKETERLLQGIKPQALQEIGITSDNNLITTIQEIWNQYERLADGLPLSKDSIEPNYDPERLEEMATSARYEVALYSAVIGYAVKNIYSLEKLNEILAIAAEISGENKVKKIQKLQIPPYAALGQNFQEVLIMFGTKTISSVTKLGRNKVVTPDCYCLEPYIKVAEVLKEHLGTTISEARDLTCDRCWKSYAYASEKKGIEYDVKLTERGCGMVFEE